MRKGIVIGVLAALVLIAAVLTATRQTLVAALLPRVIGLATGYDVTIGGERFTANHGALLHVHVSRNGEPVLDAARIDIGYSLRDLLPGSHHRYGISSIDIDDPYLTIVRHKDGSYNIALPQGNGPSPVAPQPINRVPIALTVRIRNARGELRSPEALDPQARSLGVHSFNANAVINTAARTHYTLAGAFIEHPDEPFRATGTIDVDRGYAMHHAYAAAVPIRAIANYFINSNAARILGGTAANFNARMYALDVRPYEPIEYHVSAQLDVANGGLAIIGLAQPLGDIRGQLQLVDDAFFAGGLTGTLAGVPVSLTGGIFNFAAPQYRLGIVARGDLPRLRTVFAFSRSQPVTGTADIGALVEGPLASPLIAAHADARGVAYGGIPLHDVHADIAFDQGILYMSPVQARTSGADVSLRGIMNTDGLHSELGLHVEAPADALPYAGEFLGTQPLLADALLDGHGGTFHVAGALAAASGVDPVAAVFDLEPNGVITIAPMWIHARGGGSLDGAYHLDRARDVSAFWLTADNVALHSPKHTSFLDVALPSIPPIDATVDRVALEGGGQSGTRAVAAGTIAAHGARIAGVLIDTLDARFSGTIAHAAVSPAHASGPWGTIDGSGAFSTDTLLVRGAYHGNLSGLRPFLADAPAAGRIDGPVALGIAPGRITVQGNGLALHGASVRGIPVSRLSGTLTFENGVLHVYSAHATIAGGDLVAAGTYDTARPHAADALSLVASGLDGAHLHGLGLPLDAGRVSTDGTLAAGAPLPRYDGGVSVANGRVAQYGVSGSGLVHLDSASASLERVVGSVAGTVAIAGGTLGALTSGEPRYAIHADVPAGDVSRALHTLQVPSLSSDGTFNGSFDISGAGLDPTVRGPLNVPAGSVNGLPFVNGAATIRADRSGVLARRGTVLVGKTNVAFAAAKAPSISGVHVRAPSADLSDFNNFFDTGDTLDGNGMLKFDLVSQRHRLSSNGDVNIKALRYRNLSIGDTRAIWSSRRNFLKGSLAVGDGSGTLRARGTIALAPRELWEHVVADSTYHLTLDLDDLDLSTWTAALGFPQVPVTGRVAADAKIDGRYPQLQLRGNSTLAGGTVWRLPLDSFALAFSSKGSRLQIDSAKLAAPGIDATASGSFGLTPSEPLSLSVHATSSDLPKLVAQLWRYQIPVSGDFESTVQIGGSFAKPTFEAAFDASNVEAYSIHIPSAFGSLRLQGRSLQLRNAGVSFDRGEATIAGTVPLQLSPFAIGPPDSPVSFDLALTGVDPSNFSTLLGNGTQLGGSIDGEVGLSGSVAQPRVFGQLKLAGGSYASGLERTPISAVEAALSFHGTEATVDAFHAKLGTGTLDASARVAFAKGFANTEGGASFDVAAKTRAAQLDLPAYGSGTVDANLSLSRAAGKQAALAGDATLTNATIPFAAFLAATQNSAGGAAAGPPLALGFNLKMAAGKNVRVRGGGYGAGLDIGAVGSVLLSGDVAAPTLDGRFTSTGGTLTYVDRAFRVSDASVTFRPADGLIPTLDASGVTHVVNPDPDTSRNPYGSADITIKLQGPVNNLKVAFDSNPPGYSKEQILAMIAPFGGFINGIGYTAGIPQDIGGGQQLGALQPVPGSAAANQMGTISVGQEAFNILN
ncbi:MAG TPA: translocation/assembly module TamB domain-containing protein, partial [Candidatus Baltobacteraceae bacterium]|nr:translocation/assembly module TamB domain-containing protein [Candidatus Baltobacteraceae bacterium]